MVKTIDRVTRILPDSRGRSRDMWWLGVRGMERLSLRLQKRLKKLERQVVHYNHHSTIP